MKSICKQPKNMVCSQRHRPGSSYKFTTIEKSKKADLSQHLQTEGECRDHLLWPPQNTFRIQSCPPHPPGHGHTYTLHPLPVLFSSTAPIDTSLFAYCCPLEQKLQEGRDQDLFPSLVKAQKLEECLACRGSDHQRCMDHPELSTFPAHNNIALPAPWGWIESRDKI